MILFPLVLFFSVSLGKETIKYAAVIYRHGDRTPVNPYPTDPWRNESLWPVKFGELTNLGKQQHYAFGQWLRQRYSHLLSDAFDPTEIYVRSTDVDRTLMSAQANLAGMYPPVGRSVWDNQLMWQPIPVHTKPENDDEVLAMQKKCAAYNKEMERYKNSKSYKERLDQYQELMKYLTNHTGRKIHDYSGINDIYNNLYIESLYNFTLPNWTHSYYPDKLREPACYSFSISSATPILARLVAGPLLKEIVSNISKAECINNTSHRKVSIYSGHDLTIGTMLTALGLFDGNCPQYTSAILFELIYDNATVTDYIRISYRNSTAIVEPHILNIPYCGKRCPVERFNKLYKNLLNVNFDHECSKQYNGLLGVSFLIGLLIFAAIYLTHKLCFARVSRENEFDSGYSNVHLAAMNPIKGFQV